MIPPQRLLWVAQAGSPSLLTVLNGYRENGHPPVSLISSAFKNPLINSFLPQSIPDSAMSRSQDLSGVSSASDLPGPLHQIESTISLLESHPRPELGDIFAMSDASGSTAEIAANSPHYRRSSSTFIDGVHDLIGGEQRMAPAQLYSTMSGRLFHSGRIAIVLVGPPARGKTSVLSTQQNFLSAN